MISVKKDYNDIPAILESEEVEKFREAYRMDADVKPKIDKKIYNDKSVEDSLNEIYQHKCAMCERSLYSGLIITHYRPTTLYPWLAYEWSNLFLLCPECNRAKRERFPLADEKKRLTVPPKSFYDWRADSIFLLQEEALLLNPEIHNIERLFELNLNGELRESGISFDREASVEGTIEVYDLNRKDLLHARKKIISSYISSISIKIYEYLKNDFREKEILDFIKLTNKHFVTFFDEIDSSRDSSQEYSFVHTYFYHNFLKFTSKRFKEKNTKFLTEALNKNYIIKNPNFTSLRDVLIDYQKRTSVVEVKIVLNINVNEISFAYVNAIQINNFLFLENISLDTLKEKREIYFLGENGDGKTLLLQAIFIALKGHFVISRTAKETGSATDLIRQSHLSYVATDSMDNEYYPFNDQIENSRTYLKNIFAYGVQRRAGKENQDFHGFMTLFDDSYKLIDPAEWLTELDRLEAKEKKPPVSFSVAVKILEELLNHDSEEDRSVKITFDENAKIIFTEHGTPISFNQLSEGYKSVMTWVCDLLSRLAENQPNVMDTKDYRAIVLVDEIDLHLHPKWAFSIVKKLRTWFPQIQFFFTTHSPIVILGASEEAVFYKVFKEDGVTKISEPYEKKDLVGLLANTLITSPLFGMHTASMSKQTEFDSSPDYLSSRIYKKIKEKIEKDEKSGKAYISKESIDKLIDDLMIDVGD